MASLKFYSCIRNVLLGSKKLHYSTTSPLIQYKKMRVFDCDLNYVEMDGNSDHVVFIIPGALSSIEQDLIPLLQNFDPTKFKAIAFDPPGYGQSRPPNRWEIEGLLAEQDANYATELLKKLGHKKYSLLGWSMGSVSTSIMAVRNPERVRKMVIWGSSGYFDQVSSNLLKAMSSMGIISIPESRRNQLLSLYGEEGLNKIFTKWVTQENNDDTIKAGFSKDGPFTTECLQQISVPTLIIQGTKDKFIGKDQIDYLHKNIKGSKAHLMLNGTHATHSVPTEKEFLQIVEDFLESNNVI